MVRAPLVAQETKWVSNLISEDVSSTFAATPPLEGLRFMMSRCMTGERRKPAEALVLGFYDISRAHFHSKARRQIAIRVPKEDDQCSSGYAILDKSMYGTKDAAQCFDLAVEEAMTTMGCKVGEFLPCLYHHPQTHVQVFRHGDDFVVLGSRQQQSDFYAQLSKHFIVKHLATLGPNSALGDSKEVRILNRIV